ncbi:MAG: ABC transporter permease [Armatimonadota bacterium]
MRFRRVASLVGKEIMHVRRDPLLLRMALLLPVVQLFLIGYAAQFNLDNIPTAICDEDLTPASREVVQTIEGAGYFQLVPASTDHRDIQGLMDSGRARVAVIIPRGYQRKLQSGAGAQIGLVLDGADATTSRIAAAYIESMMASQNLRIVRARLTAAGVRLPTPPIKLKPSIWYNPDLRSRHYMLPGVIGIIILTLTLSFSSLGIVREREIGTLERLNMAPISPSELIVGKLIPYLLIAIIAALVALLFAKYWFHQPMRGNIVFMFGAIMLFAINTLGLGLFMSSLASTQQQTMLGNMFVILPSILLSGFIAPIRNMPEVIQWFTYAIPLRYFVEMARGCCLKGLGPTELLPQIAALSILTLALFIAGAISLRRRL